MKRPQLVNLELEDLSEDSTTTLEYIEKLEKEVEQLRIRTYGIHIDTSVELPPNCLAM